ncbi:MAG: D-alanyl-D-alanine carboxypeptidase/D-alanyl-D-alanine-endopeptidase [Legionellales bacterium]|jgi:serine-type D-Ala-D-Ala carboxypeptidase/endopeptidase (penicillin-binding protein 4)|nr:D-alanyl-D-alanine carboxypeptidase/D-alanyl-D-alanine-endopeptidase [Legionellales bacterium]
MNQWIKLFSIALLTAVTHANNDNLNINTLSPSYTQGVAIFNLSHNKLLGTKNFNQLFNPASLQKLFTAYVALKLLGPKYNFTTTISTTGSVLQQRLNGDLVIQFSGDPTLTTHDISQLFEQIKIAGITNIRGSIIIIGSDYDYQNYGPGWMWDELDDCYAAPISNFILNKNCITANITNSNSNHAQVELTEPLDIPLKHTVYFSKNQAESCSLIFDPSDSDKYLLSGCISYGKKYDHIDIAIRNPESHIKKVIAKILAKYNIAFKHEILIKKSAQNYNYTKTWSHHSSSLANIIVSMLKKSDNMTAESLYKKIGQVYHHNTGNWENGKTAILNILADNDIILDNKQLRDGSGLSRYNSITPNQMLELLKVIKHDQEIFRVLFSSLPISGIDGTLEWLQEQTLRGKIHAKTGSMNNIYNLAGYFSDSQNDYAFVVMTAGLLTNIHLQKSLTQTTINSLLQQYHIHELV